MSTTPTQNYGYGYGYNYNPFASMFNMLMSLPLMILPIQMMQSLFNGLGGGFGSIANVINQIIPLIIVLKLVQGLAK